jgi:hypothetical protein
MAADRSNVKYLFEAKEMQAISGAMQVKKEVSTLRQPVAMNAV